MNISKIGSTAFKGKMYLIARDKDSLIKRPMKIDTKEIEKTEDHGCFSTITLDNKRTYFIDIPYKQFMMAYKLASDSKVDVDVKFNEHI